MPLRWHYCCPERGTTDASEELVLLPPRARAGGDRTGEVREVRKLALSCRRGTQGGEETVSEGNGMELATILEAY